MKREIEGVLVREKDQPAVKTDDGKTKLVFNLLDGFAGKKIKFTVEEVVEVEEEEAPPEEKTEENKEESTAEVSEEEKKA